MENEKSLKEQRAFELIETMLELKKSEVPVIYNMYKNPELKDKILSIIFDMVVTKKSSSYEHAIYAVERNYDINSYVD